MRWRIFLLVFLLPSIVCAQALPPIPPGDDKIVSIRQGDEAPFTGQLFDTPTALRWGNWLQQYQLRLKEEKSVCLKLRDVELRYQGELLEIEKRRALKVEEDLQLRLSRSEEGRLKAEEEARNPLWYNTRTFGIIVGALGAAAMVGLGVWAVGSAK